MTWGILEFRRTCVSAVVFFVLAFLLASFSSTVLAQTASTGAIKGSVTDSSGAVVPNATITATDNETAAVRTVTSGGDGSFIVTVLPLGTYRLRVQAAGFKPLEVPSIVVNVTETAAFNPVLEVGGQTQEVTVQATAEALQTTNATMGTVVSSNTATAIPLTTRNFTNLLGLSAGANTSVFNATQLGKGTTDIAVNGANLGQNGTSMDGVAVSNTTTSGLLSDTGKAPSIGLVNPDAIQEFKIQTSLFDAGYGRNVGANTNVVTKSGTNDFHGDAFEFFRNTVLDANEFFRKENTQVLNGVQQNSRQVLDQNQFGGVFGGPIKKDKLFFFGSFQELSQKNGLAAQGASVPFELPILPGGDRSNTAALEASLGQYFAPGGIDGGTSKAGGVQVAANGSNISPIAIALLQQKNTDGTYYIPSGPSVTSVGGQTVGTKVVLTDPARFTEHQYLGNGDYLINSKNTFSLRYFYANDPETISYLCGINGGTNYGICYNDNTGISSISNHYAVLKLTSILTNNLVNEARVSMQRDTASTHATNTYTNEQFGINSISPYEKDLDQITITGLFTTGTAGGLPQYQSVTNGELADDISWTHGKQTLRFGAELEHDYWNWNPAFLAVGALTFPRFQDFLLGLPGCAPGVSAAACTASGAAGQTTGTSVPNLSSTGAYQATAPPGGLNHHLRNAFGDAYVQDDIKLTSALTVNLGLRWEYDALFHDKYGLSTNIWPSLISTVPIPGSSAATGTLAGFTVPSNFPFSLYPPPVGGVFQLNRQGYTQSGTPVTNFGPRVAFAWSPLANKRLVVRSGFGIFYDRAAATIYIGGINQAAPYATPVFQQVAQYYSSLATPYQPPPTPWAPRWLNFATGTSSLLSDTSILPNYEHTPVVYQWNMTAQYELVHDWTLELGYVGSRGVHQEGIPGFTGQQGNEAELVGNPLGTNRLDAPGIDCGAACGVTTNTVANAFERVPYLGFSPAGILEFATATDTKYNSLQATLRKQFSHGLQMQAAYTWSRATATEWLYNDPDVSKYGPNPAYRPQRLAVSYVYNLPGISSEGFVGKVVNGWAVSGVTVVQDGFPLTPYDDRGGSIFGLGGGSPVESTPTFAAGMGPANIPTSGSVEQRIGGANGGPGYFNKAAFAAPPTNIGAINGVGGGTGWGNAGLGLLLGPGQFNWDISLSKTTKVGGIREGATLQFRAELFNAFNHSQFNAPGIGTNSLSTGAGVDVNNATFGQITSTSVNPRLVQFGLKYIF
ncbi:MAG: carboxypeptidase-like regulatory domain-containing protein [Candidatus Acidiferrales bacterium]|jgi:hypothetical protein